KNNRDGNRQERSTQTLHPNPSPNPLTIRQPYHNGRTTMDTSHLLTFNHIPRQTHHQRSAIRTKRTEPTPHISLERRHHRDPHLHRLPHHQSSRFRINDHQTTKKLIVQIWSPAPRDPHTHFFKRRTTTVEESYSQMI